MREIEDGIGVIDCLSGCQTIPLKARKSRRVLRLIYAPKPLLKINAARLFQKY